MRHLMCRRAFAAIWISVWAGSCSRPRLEDAPPHVVPFTAPELRSTPGNAIEYAEVSRLIAALAEIAKPDYCLSATLTGEAFPPIPNSERIGTALYTDHALDRSPALRKLVELGSQAIAPLLKHIDDGSPTHLEVVNNPYHGGIRYAREIPTNPACLAETATLEEAALPVASGEDPTLFTERSATKRHIVTVGDVCFAILGMITNRRYSAVRYQPSGIVVVNSPTEEPRLAAAARRMWDVPDPRAALFRRLLLDFHSRGEGTWGLESGASMRLLYYFPAESVSLVVSRLEDPGRPLYPELIEAVAWCEAPEVRQSLRAIARASDEKAIVIACTPVMAGVADESYLTKLRAMLLASNGGYPYPNAESHGLLAAIADLFPGRAADVFRDYLAGGGRESAINLVELLNYSHVELAPSVLVPVLDDTSDGMGYYLQDAESGVRTEKPKEVSMRLCDNAYFIISAALGEKDIQPPRNKEEMDARIAPLRQRLARG
jgi:hypothetical protein